MKTKFCVLTLCVCFMCSSMYAQVPKPTRITYRSENYSYQYMANDSRETYSYNAQNAVDYVKKETGVFFNEEWNYEGHDFMFYDAAGLLHEKVTRYQSDSTGWVDLRKTTYQYNNYGNMTHALTQDLSLDSIYTYWEKEEQINTYDPSGQKLISWYNNRKSYWTDQWETVEYRLNEYDQLGQTISAVYVNLYSFNPYISKYTYEYDAFGRMTQEAFYSEDDSVWQVEYKLLYVYDNDTSKNYVVYEYRNNSSAPNLTLFHKTRFEFSGPSYTTMSWKTYDNGVNWYNRSKSETLYNGSTFLSTKSYDWLIGFGNVWGWRIMYNETYNYNPDNSIASIVVKREDYNVTPFRTVSEVLYEYSPMVNTSFVTQNTSVQVFPNPTTDFVHIDLQSGRKQQTTCITLTDVQGRTVYQHRTTSRQATISLQQQPAGLYYVQVEQGGAVKTIPVVKR
jgi:hypothetical protein